MHRTTINLSEPIYRQARIKALREDVTVSEVVRDLLTRWVAGEIDLTDREKHPGQASSPGPRSPGHVG